MRLPQFQFGKNWVSQNPRDDKCGWMKLVLQRTKFSGGSSRQSRIPANINKIIANSPYAYNIECSTVFMSDNNRITATGHNNSCLLSVEYRTTPKAYLKGRRGDEPDRVNQHENQTSQFQCCTSDQVDFFFIEPDKTW